MLIESLAFVLEKSQCIEPFWRKLDQGEDATLGVASSARPFLVAARFAQKPQPTLVVVAGEESSLAFARSLSSYLGENQVYHFPERKDTPFAPKRPDFCTAARRMQAAWALQEGRNAVVVASARALVRLMPPASALAAAPLVLHAGCDLSAMAQPCSGGRLTSYDDALVALEMRGYENTGELDGPGTFATRGGVIDIYPGNLTYPVRLDFFGDELEEIRRIIPSTGQTVSSLDKVEIYPVLEYESTSRRIADAKKKLKRRASTNPALRTLLENLEGGLRFDGADGLLPFLYDNLATLGDYVACGGLVSIMEPRSLVDDMAHALEELSQKAKGSGLALDSLYASAEAASFGDALRATYVSIMQVGGMLDAELPVKRVEVAGHPDKLYGRLRTLIDGSYTVVFSSPNHRARKDMELELVERGLPIQEVQGAKGSEDGRLVETAGAEKRRLRKGVVNVTDVDIPLGMIIPAAKLALVSLTDTQGSKASQSTRRHVDITEVTFPYKPGDYVVHAAHGVAHFKELLRRDIDGVSRDYLLLEYAEGDKLYVPVEQLDRVTRYVGPEGASPRLTRLNTADWSRAVSKATAATKKLAFDLVDVYARRASVRGYAYPPDSWRQREMEEAFPYQETSDQLSAIADTKSDMESPKPMDRLICGDVGFGKTEVALRAAFKAVDAGKQVMVLCPTTILAQQHYTSFSDRFEPFGIRVEVLSRFRTPEQQRSALAGFETGEVSVLVGTHRLLSRDVNPHDLGLVIIDEEQRFGVGHKEQLKHLRESTDVLTLSATPIPRTMQMSLSGVRDMSLIMTPPDQRRPVSVHVGEWDPDLVSDAIRRELARKGQVYYVSNRVRSIEDAVARVQHAAEEARVGVAHGQMSKEQLERVMEEFAAGKLDVLVATTIIESGIDNPHTNTLIIEDSQRLGLAQMYQLKGRVGRSSEQAYAYFMFPDNIPLTEEAQARLTALSEHQELGSGLRIAMKDLEIRGAGNILGAEQSGNMSAVGFDLFAQMLAQAVSATKEGDLKSLDQLPPALSDITVNLPGHTYLSEDYIPATDERVLWYRKLASASTEQAVQDIYNDLQSKRPDMPQAAKNLFSKARLKAFANEHHIKIVSVVAGKLTVEPIDIPRDKLIPLRRAQGRYLADKRKLLLPLRYFKLDEGDNLIQPVYELLSGLVGGGAES